MSVEPFTAELQRVGTTGTMIDMELDTEPRKVAVPADLRAALADAPAAGTAFRTFSYPHQREYVQWIEEAKRADTRARRVAATADRVASGGTLRRAADAGST